MSRISSVPETGFEDKFRKQFCKTQMCSFSQKGRCKRGAKCMFAHNKEELQQRPDLNKTALCPFKQTCTNPKCTYAHCISELQRTEQFAKTTPCRYHLAGNCKLGDACLHSHSEAPQKTTTVDKDSPCAYDSLPLPPWSRSTTAGTVASTFEDVLPFSRTSTTSTLSGVASSSSVWTFGPAAQGYWAGMETGGANTWASTSLALWQVMQGGQDSGGQQHPTVASRSKDGIAIPAAWLQNGGVSSSVGLVAVGNGLVAIDELEDQST